MYPGWSNPINFYAVSEANSNMDFKQTYDKNSRYSAYVETYKYGRILVTPAQKDYMDWRFGVIHLNEYRMGSMNSNDVIGIIVHEIGHVLGLKDVNNINVSIMHFNDERFHKRVTNDANSAIVRKYK